jgi:DNA-binding transcriptional LysR family regulator
MNIKSLRAFRHTLDTGSVVEASRLMHLSPSAVSRLIATLEGTLRLTLFDRQGRRLLPTAEGRAFYREARRILDNLEQVRRIADEIREGSVGRLRIVTMPRTLASLVSPSVARFMEVVPDARVSLDVRRHREAERWLAGREYDLGIGALPVSHPDVGTRNLLQARAQAVLPRGHRLSEHVTIDIEELASEPLIALLPGLIQRAQADDMFGAVGVAKSSTCEVASSRLACQLVADGAGVTIADSLSAHGFGPDTLVLRPIVPERWVAFGLLLPRHATMLGQHGELMIQILQQTAKKLAADDPYVRISE